MVLGAALTLVMVAIASAHAAEPTLEALTEDGRKVILHPDGRWQFATPDTPEGAGADKPAAPTATAPAASGTASAAAARPDDRFCIGGLFGVGRRVCPGDPEYNRGSLNPKLR